VRTGQLALLDAPVLLHRPGLGVVIGSALIALTLVVALWWIVGHAITLAHEGGHALVAVLLGGAVAGVLVNRDRTGLTSTPSLGPVRLVFVRMAGYLAPSGFGLLSALLIVLGQFPAVLWVSVLLLVLLLAVSRSWFTRFVVVATGAVIVVALRTRSEDFLLWTACIWAWLLLMGGLVNGIAHFGSGGDHQLLRDSTYIPVWFWSVLFAGSAVVAFGYALFWLTGMSNPPLTG
jgi:Peptidase M50B-like